MGTNIRKKLAGKQSKLGGKKIKVREHPADRDNNYQDGAFYNVEIDLIQPNPYQPRQHFDLESLAELADSIRQKGVIQPIVIRKDEDDNIFLVAGERRLRASKDAGLEKIPAVLTTGNPIEISIIENLQRENLKPVEEAEALNRMIKEYSYTQEQLAKVIGKGRSTITETLSLNKLPEEVKKECRHADFPKRVLVEITKKKTPEKMIELFNRVKSGALKGEKLRDEVRNREKAPKRTPAAIILEKAGNLNQSLNKIDLNTVEEAEKMVLIKELNDLKKQISQLID